MSYKITEEGNISTVFLDGEIDMDVTEKAKEVILPLVESTPPLEEFLLLTIVAALETLQEYPV